MDSFLTLNRQKLKFALGFTSLLFSTFVLIIFGYSYSKGNIPELRLFFTVLLGTGIGVPLLIITSAYLEWMLKTRARRKCFRMIPLEELGFNKDYMNQGTKWLFTEEIKSGLINGYLILCEVRNSIPRKVEFTALVYHKNLNKEMFNALQDKLKPRNIFFDFGGIQKIYNLKSSEIKTEEQLRKNLLIFTEILKEEGFEPVKTDTPQ